MSNLKKQIAELEASININREALREQYHLLDTHEYLLHKKVIPFWLLGGFVAGYWYGRNKNLVALATQGLKDLALINHVYQASQQGQFIEIISSIKNRK